MDYRCRECGAVFKRLPRYGVAKTHYDCSTIVMLLRGFAKGVPTGHQTDEMDLAYPSVLKRRHRIQEAVQRRERTRLPGEAPQDGLPDPEVEADEMYQNAGEKGKSHRNPDDPPLPTAVGTTKPSGGAPSRTTGLRSWEWLVAKRGGPASGSVSTRRKRPFGGQLPEKRQRRPAFLPMRTVRTCGSKMRRNPGPAMPSITPKAGPRIETKTEFERSTSVRPEGIWTSLRNRLRRFRGVHKDHLSGYVAMSELAFNHDQVTPALLQRMCGA